MDVPRLVVDASVAVKWFVADDERGAEDALSLLHGHAGTAHVLAAPDHLRLEVLNALRSRGLSRDALVTAGRHLEGLHLEWFPIDLEIAEAACRWADDLTLYDAAYAALAARLDVELVTADRRLAESGACRCRLL